VHVYSLPPPSSPTKCSTKPAHPWRAPNGTSPSLLAYSVYRGHFSRPDPQTLQSHWRGIIGGEEQNRHAEHPSNLKGTVADIDDVGGNNHLPPVSKLGARMRLPTAYVALVEHSYVPTGVGARSEDGQLFITKGEQVYMYARIDEHVTYHCAYMCAVFCVSTILIRPEPIYASMRVDIHLRTLCQMLVTRGGRRGWMYGHLLTTRRKYIDGAEEERRSAAICREDDEFIPTLGPGGWVPAAYVTPHPYEVLTSIKAEDAPAYMSENATATAAEARSVQDGLRGCQGQGGLEYFEAEQSDGERAYPTSADEPRQLQGVSDASNSGVAGGNACDAWKAPPRYHAPLQVTCLPSCVEGPDE